VTHFQDEVQDQRSAKYLKNITRDSGAGGGGARVKAHPPKNLGKNPRKSGQKWHPTLVDFKKWLSTFAEKHTNPPLLEVTPRKGLHDLCGRKFVGKRRTKTFRASLGKLRQKSFAPPNVCLLLHL